MIRVLLPASEIPLPALVTKRSGEKQYTLRDKIAVYTNLGSPPQVIVAQNGARFLVAENGDASAVDSTTDLVWYASEVELQTFLDGPGQ